MILLYHGSGARDFVVLDETLTQSGWQKLKSDAIRLLNARNLKRASEILHNSNFQLYNGINNFGDEFSVLILPVTIEEYVEFENNAISEESHEAYRHIADAISQLGPYIRFIAIGINTESDSQVVTPPALQITTEVVERALSDAEHLLNTTGAVSAVDRIHTTIHGYVRAVCDNSGISYQSGASLTFLFREIRNHHPNFQNLGPRTEDVERILRAMSTILDSVNTLRNLTSIAHPNEDLLGEDEALLVINSVRTILHYLDSKLRNP